MELLLEVHFVKHIIDDSLSNNEKIKKSPSIVKEIKEK